MLASGIDLCIKDETKSIMVFDLIFSDDMKYIWIFDSEHVVRKNDFIFVADKLFFVYFEIKGFIWTRGT